MSKYISFSDSKFFGQTFSSKYEDFKKNQIESLNFKVNYMNIMPTQVKIIGMESDHKENLEKLAIETAKNLFPVIESTGIEILATIEYNISHNSISRNGTPDYPKQLPPNNEELYKKAAKQKILNALCQGAAVAMNSVHHMVDEVKNINPTLKANYDTLMKSNEVAYFTINPQIFAQMAIQSNREQMVGGTNVVEFRNGIPFIIAKAVNFVNLVHEIVKGVYTYLTLNAYDTEEEYYEVTQYTDSIYSEIEDIGCGKMLLNNLRNYLIDNFEKYYEHPSFFEMFIVAFSKLPADEVISLTESILNGTPNRSKFEILARNCYYDLKDFEKKKYFDE